MLELRQVYIGFIGLVAGLVLGSWIGWDEPARLPSTDELRAIAATVRDEPPEPIVDGGGPAVAQQEDFRGRSAWEVALFGHLEEGETNTIAWTASVLVVDEAEARLRGDGWDVERGEDPALTASRGHTLLVARVDSETGLEVEVSRRPSGAHTVWALALAPFGAAVALGLAWWRRRAFVRWPEAETAAVWGAVGLALLLPSAFLVVVSVLMAAMDPAYGMPELWKAAHMFWFGLPIGLVLNVGVLLLMVEGVGVARRVLHARAFDAGAG